MIMCGRHFENIATEAFSYWVIHSIDRYSVLFRCIDLMSYSLLKFNMMPPNSFVVFPHSKHAFIAWQTIFAETLLLCIYLLIRSTLFGCRSQRYMMLLFAERTDNSSHNKSFGYIKTCAIPMNLLFWISVRQMLKKIHILSLNLSLSAYKPRNAKIIELWRKVC